MKTTNSLFRSAASILAVVALLFSSGCSKEENSLGPAGTQEPEQLIRDARLRSAFDRQIENMPAIAWYNTTIEKYIVLEPKSQIESKDNDGHVIGFESLFTILFTDISPADVYPLDFIKLELNFTAVTDGGVVFGSSVLPIGSANESHGTVSVGNTNLDINNLFRFPVGEEFSGNDLLNIGGFSNPYLTGYLSIGCDCHMGELTTGNFENPDDIFDYFRGLVFISNPSSYNGRTPINNWFGDQYSNDYNNEDGAYAWGYSFARDSWNAFFSQQGELKISNGLLESQGTFYTAEFGNESLNESGSGDKRDITYKEYVSGYGFLRE